MNSRPIRDIVQKAKTSPYYKASNEQIIEWANTLPPDIVANRCLLALALYSQKFYLQWSNTIEEGDYVSLLWIVHTRALKSWDRFHPYSAWFGQYLRTACVTWLRQSKTVWVPMIHYDREYLAQFECSNPDTNRDVSEQGSFWETIQEETTDPLNKVIIDEIRELAPELVAMYHDGIPWNEVMPKDMKNMKCRKSVNTYIEAQRDKIKTKYFK